MKILNFTHINEFFQRIDHLKKQITKIGTIIEEDRIDVLGSSYPIYSIHLGSQAKDVPTIAFIGGVHGLEVIGAQVLLSYLETICTLSEWDNTVHELFEGIKVLFYPCVNPGGMALQTRANPRGVDLMRNSPMEADSLSPFFLPGGHRISPSLPWYRGKLGEPMEKENEILLRVIKEEVWNAPFSMIIDFHSGFGMKDRIWFPYANTKTPFPRLPEIYKLKTLFDQSYPYNVHTFEPQAKAYRTHGDLWDYVFANHYKDHPEKVMIPLCLELGSWLWIKKNPSQIFNSLGFFNPMVPHRQQRTLRRHIYLLDFLMRATHSSRKWSFPEEEEKDFLELNAKKLWY